MSVLEHLNNVSLLSCFFCGDAEANQELIMAEGGITLLSMTASDAEDPQTLRMVAGAIANLCGNGIFPYFLFLIKLNVYILCNKELRFG